MILLLNFEVRQCPSVTLCLVTLLGITAVWAPRLKSEQHQQENRRSLIIYPSNVFVGLWILNLQGSPEWCYRRESRACAWLGLTLYSQSLATFRRKLTPGWFSLWLLLLFIRIILHVQLPEKIYSRPSNNLLKSWKCPQTSSPYETVLNIKVRNIK